MASNEEWARGYALQARADYRIYEYLCGQENFPECQRYHFLQMACEKISKAYRCWEGEDPKKLKYSHAYAAKTLPAIFMGFYRRAEIKPRVNREHLLKSFREAARDIDLLAPTVREGGSREDNCEYPWEDPQGSLHVPAQERFQAIRQIETPRRHQFLTLLVRSIEEMAKAKF